MPILSNVEIKKFAEDGRLIFDTIEECFQPCSYDMRIGSIFRDGQVINADHLRGNEQIRLDPGEVITMTTLESLHLPPGIAGTAHAINSQSSDGLLVLNPGHIDPGYKGYLTVMAVNMRRVPYVISRKDKIFTIVFQRLGQDANPPYPEISRSREDRERDLNKKIVEKAVQSLGDLVALNAPFTRPADVNALIRSHWATYTVMAATVVAAGASLVAAYFAVATFLHSPSSTPSLSTSANVPALSAAPTFVSTPLAGLPSASKSVASGTATSAATTPTAPSTAKDRNGN